jgi:hypothetical protein
MIFVLLRTLRFPEIRTCETINELGGYKYYIYMTADKIIILRIS